MDVLFIFAHQDDEYGALPWIVKELRDGNSVSCIYLTDGGSRTAPEVRDRESIAVLMRLGVAFHNICFLGDPDRIHDGSLLANIARGEKEVSDWLALRGRAIRRIYSPAWEGGHPDHDVVHVIALYESLRLGIESDSWQFSIYNGYRCRKFFRSLRQIPSSAKKRSVRHRLADGIAYAFMCLMYRSQLRTWLGLFPEAFMHRVVIREESVSQFQVDRVTQRPHEGPLLYERMFATHYEDLSEAIAPILSEIRRLRDLAAGRSGGSV